MAVSCDFAISGSAALEGLLAGYKLLLTASKQQDDCMGLPTMDYIIRRLNSWLSLDIVLSSNFVYGSLGLDFGYLPLTVPYAFLLIY